MDKTIIVFFGILFTATQVWCQIEIQGKVISKDDKSELPGINVLEKGTTNGTVTDFNGRFIITVNDSNSILMFASVGYESLELTLPDVQGIIIKIKPRCHRDWFDAQRIGIYAVSGFINTPIGGQFELSFPAFISQATLWSDEIQYLSGKIGLHHLFVSCDFDADVVTYFRKVSWEREFNSRTLSIETNLNYKSLRFILGLSTIDLNEYEIIDNRSGIGPLLGIGTWIGRPFNCLILGKASIYKDLVEYQVELNKRFKRIETFVDFYKLDSFVELSLGIGYEFTYRYKRQKIKRTKHNNGSCCTTHRE